MTQQQVVLVAGYDFQHHNPALFPRKCANRADYILRHSRNADLRFIRFDMAAGRVEQNHDGARAKDGTLNWRAVDPAELGVSSPYSTDQAFEPVNRKKHYSDGHLVHDQSRVAHLLSITDVYRFVQRLGSQAPGTLQELSIFSHGYNNGPILLNSSDYEEECIRGKRGPRDNVDKDGRMKDFASRNMHSKEADAFKHAFSHNGQVWIWGCDVDSRFRFVFSEMIDRNRANFKRVTPNVDNLVFTFKFPSWRDAKFMYDRSQKDEEYVDFFPQPFAVPNSLEFNRYLWSIKKFLLAGLRMTYAARLAKAAGVVTYATLPGMEAAYEARDGLMEVLKNKGDQGAMLVFYKRVADVQEDQEKRGYGAFDSKVVTSMGVDTDAC